MASGMKSQGVFHSWSGLVRKFIGITATQNINIPLNMQQLVNNLRGGVLVYLGSG